MKLKGAEIIWECLIREGVDTVFGYPGGNIMVTHDALAKYPQIHHVLTRHEQGAAHMADGYARASGRVGVAIATSGPGATNLVTGIATAMMDSSPMVCITGQVATPFIGSDAFQETDVTGVTLPVTKHNYLVTDVRELAYTIREAFHIARTGRPGPVLIDVPKDVQLAETDFIYPEDPIVLPGYKPATGATEDEIEQTMAMIAAAERPLILAGQGVLMSGAMVELQAFVEKMQVPVALTLLGKGGIPENHPLVLGMMGMHGESYVNHAIQESDLLLAFGMRFDDRVTGNLKTYAQKAKKIHIDVDASEINKNVPVDLGIIGDLKTVLAQVTPRMQAKRHNDWMEQISEWQDDSAKRDIVNKHSGGKLYAAHVIHDLWEQTNGDAIIVTDVGQHQMWEAQYYPHIRPHTLITSGGAGTMGFGMPAAVGAKMSMPEEEVWSISGDGGFQMTLFELATAVQERVPVNIAIINNEYLGMVRQWQELFFEERYIATPISHPDFIKLAEAYGIPAIRVTKREDIQAAVEKARNHNDGPFLIEFVVEQQDIVYPMVPSGATLDNMIRRPKAE